MCGRATSVLFKFSVGDDAFPSGDIFVVDVLHFLRRARMRCDGEGEEALAHIRRSGRVGDFLVQPVNNGSRRLGGIKLMGT